MSYKQQERRLAALEAAAEARRLEEWQREVDAMSDDELDAHIDTFIATLGPWDPDVKLALGWLSDADIARLAAGELDRDDILQMYRASQRQTP